jgi:hypothetical protein
MSVVDDICDTNKFKGRRLFSEAATRRGLRIAVDENEENARYPVEKIVLRLLLMNRGVSLSARDDNIIVFAGGRLVPAKRQQNKFTKSNNESIEEVKA